MARSRRRTHCAHLFDGKIRTTDFTHFSGLYRIIQRLDRIRNGCVRIRKMNLVKIDGLDLKPAEACVERLTHVFRTRALLAFAHFHPKLGSNDYVMAAALERLAEKLFAPPAAVN